jgi:hypothetical protein
MANPNQQAPQPAPGGGEGFLSIVTILIVGTMVFLFFANVSETYRLWTTIGLSCIVALFFLLRLRSQPLVRNVGPRAGLIVLAAAVLLTSRILPDPHGKYVLKFVFILLLSLFPGWLYYQFVRVKTEQLWNEYVGMLYTLQLDSDANLPKPTSSSPFFARWSASHNDVSADVSTTYHQKFETIHGNRLQPVMSERRESGASLLVAIATVLFAIGWMLTLDSIAVGSWFGLEVPLGATKFAFVGAYIHTLEALVRRYWRLDLRDVAYVMIMKRVIVVCIISVVAEAIWPALDKAYLNAFAFAAGYFPEVALHAILGAVKAGFQRAFSRAQKDFRLTTIEGVNLWNENRLNDEGIENVQHLATVDLADLLLRVRLSPGQLLDWIDQALLLMHLPRRDAEGLMEKLRAVGVRSASTLAAVISVPQNLAPVDAALGGSGRATALLVALQREKNLRHVLVWATSEK